MTIRAIPPGRISNPKLIHVTEQILENCRSNSTIQAHLSGYGYESEDLEEGQERVDAFSDSLTTYQRLRGQEETLIQDRNDARKALRKGLLRDHVQRADLAFGEQDGVVTELSIQGLLGDRLTMSDWIVRSRRFYGILMDDADLLSVYAEQGLGRESLEGGLNALNEVADLHREYVARQSEREQHRRIRDDERLALEAWVRKFQRTAKYALESEMDLLQQVGFQVTD